MSQAYHKPVLLTQCIEALVTDRNGIYLDATFGGGGHSREILDHIGSSAQLIAMDQDQDARMNAIDDSRFRLQMGNFRFVKHYLRYFGVTQLNGILADLGVSSYQLDAPSKGFSFSGSEVFDMRMNQRSAQSAIDIINHEKEESLVNIFSSYGEVRNSKTLAKAIITARELRPISNTHEFLNCVEPQVMGNKARYLAQVFQAIRIKVNDEIGALQDFLVAGADMLVPGGRLVVLTYHSIEDRVVKHFIKSGHTDHSENYMLKEDRQWILKPVNKKPILPDAEEIKLNSRARSAKLRIAEKI
ncbi:MAG: 16S rRNA (cytosine(1402)-N(4))-methyltransferase RsmH [Saprospiraceae bacterium]|nr:16S rRNA (cytosine(1402)-N(4))-methyltransferase RsmH [Saprospiraceae bacterium]